jgi:hypothetical protein
MNERFSFRTLWLACAVVALAACGGVEEDGLGDDPSQEEDLAETQAAVTAPSCVYLTGYSATRWCGQRDYYVTNSCSTTQYIRVDLPDRPDTACKYVSPGTSATFTSGCNDGVRPRSLQKC